VVIFTHARHPDEISNRCDLNHLFTNPNGVGSYCLNFNELNLDDRILAGPRHRDTWRTIIQSITDAGYAVLPDPLILSPHRLSPSEGGAPQVRERVFILAIKKSNPTAHFSQYLSVEDFTPSIDWNPNDWRIENFLIPDRELEKSVLDKCRLSDDEHAWVSAWDFFVGNIYADKDPGRTLDSLPGFPIWVDAFRSRPKISDSMPDWEKNFLQKNSNFYREHKAFIDEWLKMKWGSGEQRVSEFPRSRRKLEWQARNWHQARQKKTFKDLVLQMRPSGIRVKAPTYLPALVAMSQTSIVGPKVKKGIRAYRRLSPYESASLQGMSGDLFLDTHPNAAYKQLGNAVNVGVVRFLAERLITLSKLGERSEPLFKLSDSLQLDLLNRN
jgi:DNA (cytosine-5)-methyltransferase 1